jgi:hypothetical protein
MWRMCLTSQDRATLRYAQGATGGTFYAALYETVLHRGWGKPLELEGKGAPGERPERLAANLARPLLWQRGTPGLVHAWVDQGTMAWYNRRLPEA